MGALNLSSMFWAAIVTLLVMWCTGSSSQPTLSQPLTASVSPGNTVKLSCAISSGSTFANHVGWYQQNPGNSPRWLLSYYSDSNKYQGSGVPARFSGSKDSSGSTGYLTITGVQAEDEADYYCGTWHSSAYIFGGGTQLSVLGQPASRPTVNVFSPSPEELRTTDKATLPCLVSDFMPPAIEVDWLADGSPISSGVETTKPTKHNDKYMLSSYLTMPSSEWEKHNEYTCKVTHEGSEYRKTVNRSQ